MKIFFEGAKYSLNDLKGCIGDRFYHQIGNNCYINTVGYYHSKDNQLYYFLPKLFITENDNFLDTKIHYLKFFEKNIEHLLFEKNIDLLNWFRKFLVIFYKSLIEYKNRINNKIIQIGDTLQLSTNIGKNEFTFLDLVLTILNFYKKNKDFFMFHNRERKSKRDKKTNWNKTIRKQKPIFLENAIIYEKLHTKAKIIHEDDILMTYFYSVLYYLKDEYNVDITIDCPYNIIKGEYFNKLFNNGLYKLKKIKNNYFSDKLKNIYNLLILFFEKSFLGNVNSKNDDFIIVKKYHNVFEDMIDKILSDTFSDRETSNNISLKSLKNNKDGKILDHLFEFDSILDTDESVFYIGDSKYYKHNSNLSDNSIYKQFTYAKNVIQFNIDLLQENNKLPSLINKDIRYRDEITEGYSISPNFFIQGVIKDINDFDVNGLIQNAEKGTEKNAHFKERLFDRDTLFINYYEINFLFVLNSYINFSNQKILETRNIFKNIFKNHFKSYFKNHSNFDFYEFNFNTEEELKEFVNFEFRNIIGRAIRTISQPNRLIIAINKEKEKKLNDQNIFNKLKIENNVELREKIIFYVTSCPIKPEIKDFVF